MKFIRPRPKRLVHPALAPRILAAALALASAGALHAGPVAFEATTAGAWTANDSGAPSVTLHIEHPTVIAVGFSFAGLVADEVVNTTTFPFLLEGSFTFTTLEGDSLFGLYTGSAAPTGSPGELLGHALFQFTGGTGGLAGASGDGTLEAVVQFSGPLDGVSVWSWSGTVKAAPEPQNGGLVVGALLLVLGLRCSRARHGRGPVLGALLLAATFGPDAQAQQGSVAPFTRIADGGIGVDQAFSVIGAWGDYDNDGWLDLFVGNQRNAVSWLYHNNRNGTFTKAEAEPVTTDIFGETWSAAWSDYNNDGWLDLIVSNHDWGSPARLYRNHGGGSFSLVSPEEAGPLAEDISRTQGLSWADYDNDGRLDLFVANGDLGGNYPDVLYRNEGGGRFSRVDNSVTSPELSSTMGTWSDYDDDGDMDLFVTHTGGVGNTLFRNDGQGRFVDVTVISGLGDTGESAGAAWGDYDNDGHLDLFVTNVRLTGAVTPNFFYHSKGGGQFERITTGVVAMDQDHFVSSAWIDYDNDGWLDLFLTVLGMDSSKPKNRLYRNQGDGTFVKVDQGRLVTDSGQFGSSAWGDYDNDGFPDVFVTFGTIYSAQRSALYRNDGNGNNWIKIRCVGTVSNRSAIGAKIRVKARIGGQDRWQMRQIVGSEGWVTFNSLDAVIGLGDASAIDTLRVEWPSGLVQEFHDVGVKQTLVLVEHTGLSIVRAGNHELELTVSGPRQQRYRVETSSDLKLWSPATLLTITNENGMASSRYTLAAAGTGMYFRAVAE